MSGIVRCSTCGADGSVWAPRCPGCGASLDGTELVGVGSEVQRTAATARRSPAAIEARPMGARRVQVPGRARRRWRGRGRQGVVTLGLAVLAVLALVALGSDGGDGALARSELTGLQQQWAQLAAYDRPLLDGLVRLEATAGSHAGRLARAYGEAVDGLGLLETRFRAEALADQGLRRLRDRIVAVLELHRADLRAVEDGYLRWSGLQPPSGITPAYLQAEATVQLSLDAEGRRLGVGAAPPARPVDYPSLDRQLTDR